MFWDKKSAKLAHGYVRPQLPPRVILFSKHGKLWGNVIQGITINRQDMVKGRRFLLKFKQ